MGNGLSSTAFETYDSWASRNEIDMIDIDKKEARNYLMDHFLNVGSNESVKRLEKILSK